MPNAIYADFQSILQSVVMLNLVMLSAVMLSVVMLSEVMLSVIMQNVVAPPSLRNLHLGIDLRIICRFTGFESLQLQIPVIL